MSTRLLVNLPSGFYREPRLAPVFDGLRSLAELDCIDTYNLDEFMPKLHTADAVLMWSWPKLGREELGQCPRLRFAGHLDIRPDHAAALLDRGIAVSVGRGGFSPAVAEMALTLILSSLRRTSTYHAAMWRSAETWVKRFPDDIDADERELTGLTVGMIGFGGIGRRLAELLAPFRCTLLVADPYVPDRTAAAAGGKLVTVDLLAAQAEVVVVCASANAGTKHILGAAQIAALRPGSVIVNVSRASLVDSDALLARLQGGDIYAALDVFETEPLPADSPLRSLPNVYLTPHRAGGIMESVVRIVRFLADDFAAWLSGAERTHALKQEMLPGLDA